MFEKTYEIRWDDVDALQHVRHTAYGTYAAQSRLAFFADFGVDFDPAKLDIAPVLFTEQLAYRREIRLNDTIRVTSALSGLSDDSSRWAISHEAYRRDGQLAATIEVTGAWIDMIRRKLVAPPPEVSARMHELPKAAGFVRIDR
ncbi:MAG: acyl-CoA thioesterase [Actinobacteria bacterium]|nr:acyl-CoA thioesterase [Actinomycetota bacterium]